MKTRILRMILILILIFSPAFAFFDDFDEKTLKNMADLILPLRIMDNCHKYQRKFYKHPVYKKVFRYVKIHRFAYKFSFYELNELCEETLKTYKYAP